MTGKAKHGLSYTPEYRVWQTMRLRCTEPSNPAWKDYGGRGITICRQWLDSPEQFLADLGPKPSAAHELDRRDNDGPYSPDNCRWVVRKVNCRNRRSNRLIEFRGETKPLAEWAEEFELPRDTLKKRMDAGWTPEQALTIPARPKARAGEAKPKKQAACADCGTQTYGKRCKSCENKRRWNAGEYS